MSLSQYNIQETTNQINQLVSQSSDALLCGPDCQKIRKTDLLRQSYLDAQSNVETSPIQLQEAEKNYYTYTQGDAGYNTIRKNELSKQAAKIISTATATFQTELDKAKDSAKTYNTLHITSQTMEELYKKYIDENKELQKKLIHLTTDTITNDRKSFYESQGYDTLNNWYILWNLFYQLFQAHSSGLLFISLVASLAL